MVPFSSTQCITPPLKCMCNKLPNRFTQPVHCPGSVGRQSQGRLNVTALAEMTDFSPTHWYCIQLVQCTVQSAAPRPQPTELFEHDNLSYTIRPTMPETGCTHIKYQPRQAWVSLFALTAQVNVQVAQAKHVCKNTVA